jgi:dihydrofolate synthase/folylpolyglutamate synthase
LETVSVAPKVVLDVAHNPSAARVLVAELRELFEFSKLIFVVGIMKNKDIPLIINELAKISDEAIAVKPDTERASDPEKIVHCFQERGIHAIAVENIGEAISEAKIKAGRDGLVCVTGSFFTVAEAYSALGVRV